MTKEETILKTYSGEGGKSSEDDGESVEASSDYQKGFECGKQMVLKYPRDFNLQPIPEEKPEPYFYCKYGGTIPKCSDCKRNHSNSKYKTEEIHNWYSPSMRGTKMCSCYVPIEKSKSSEKPNDQVVEGEVILNGHGLLVDVTKWGDGHKLKVIIKED